MGLKDDEWKNFPRQKTKQYQQWEDAQIQSNVAAQLTSNFEKAIFPLEKSRFQDILDGVWKSINQVCICPYKYLEDVVPVTHFSTRITDKSADGQLKPYGV